VSTDSARFPRWAIARSPWLLVTLHAPFAAAAPLFVITRQPLTAGPVVLVVLTAVAIGGLQLRHSFAAARGERPPGALWTFLALVALAYLPTWWLGWDWLVIQWFVMASGAMVLRGPPAVVAVAAPVIGTSIAVWYFPTDVSPGSGPGLMLAYSIYSFALLMMGSASLYGSAWLVRVLNDLDTARTELAELAVARERLRVSRDLHDLLGQSLSAVSLKGEVALRLLPTDTAAAHAEIDSLTGVARRALHDVRAVTRDEHGVTLAAEIDAASALLGAAGIVTEVNVDLPDLAHPTEEVFAWVVREGATNTLRHSQATRWTVTGARRAGRVVLEIVNDGAPAQIGHGSGLAGLHERALDLSGSATAERTPDGRFRLHVELPEDDS
jgi:two-component system, NarL family, sensor histidine kinase DesK